MFGVKERHSVVQSANVFDESHAIGTLRNIRSILIVDEDRDVLNQLSQSFAICAKQYNIYLAQNGRDALEVLRTSKVNILLTALNVPGTQDFELPDYTTIYYPATRIFVMAEDDPSIIKNRLADLRISGYIRKPLRIEMIYSILRV
jgi:response regulator RpfG family c-di-GMP phosphodiesterase